MEFFNYDYHAEKYEVIGRGNVHCLIWIFRLYILHLQYLTNQKDLNHGLDILII